MATVALPIDLGRICLGSTKRLRFTFKKDGVAWQGIDSAIARFEAPDRSTQFDRNLTLENDTNGIWYYDITTTDFDNVDTDLGRWTVNVRATDSSIVDWYPEEISFEVVDLP